MKSSTPKSHAKLEVTVISGFLGAGKTTLLNELIRNAAGERIAIIVNDIGETNIDASLINSEIKHLDGEIEEVVELSGGCICCTIQGDLVDAIDQFSRKAEIDHLLVESTGIADPMSIVQAFYSPTPSGMLLADNASIDSLITVIDSAFLLKEWEANTEQGSCRKLIRQGDERPVFELIIDQIECADILVLNKSDLLSDRQQVKLRSMLSNLNDRAVSIECEFGRVDKNRILHAKRFDPEATLSGANWLRSIEQGSPRDDSMTSFKRVAISQSSLASPSLKPSNGPEPTIASQINTLVYRARRPLRAQDFNELISTSIEGLLRAKGYCWIQGKDDKVGFLSIAGSTTRCDFVGSWWADALENGRIDRSQVPAEVERKWESPHGDRRQELVFIGFNLDEAKLKAGLDACLV